MAVPIKISSVIINSFKSCYDDGQGCKGCGATNSNSCYQCSTNPDMCVCEASSPSRTKCHGGWVKQKPPTETQMLAPGNSWPPWPRSCEDDCDQDWIAADRGNAFAGDWTLISRQKLNEDLQACYKKCRLADQAMRDRGFFPEI